MANSESIKKYLIESEKPYLEDDANNGNILMLSGAWGSGKTHFWKNIIEKDLIPKIKEKEKSYIFVSLYGKDSIEELQNEILQKSYSFVQSKETDIISQTYSVFTKMTSLMPKITVFGVGIDASNTSKQIEELNNNEKLKKGTDALLNGGIICFDDFERKSSKIDLNDLFGFITNLTENFQTKTIIILNQEFFQENDTKVFNTVKEKSISKFILYNPSIEELFEVIYQNTKYQPLDSYKTTILEAIQLSEEKNARIYIQVLNNCLEYAEKVKEVNERVFYLLTLTTIIFVKYNLIFRMKEYQVFFDIAVNTYFLPLQYELISEKLSKSLIQLRRKNIFRDNIPSKEKLSDELKKEVSNTYSNADKERTTLFEENLKDISTNIDLLYVIYKYIIHHICFKRTDADFLQKINNFVESGILLEE